MRNFEFSNYYIDITIRIYKKNNEYYNLKLEIHIKIYIN